MLRSACVVLATVLLGASAAQADAPASVNVTSKLVSSAPSSRTRGHFPSSSSIPTGQFRTLHEVLEHYGHAAAVPNGHSELSPLTMSDRQLDEIELFLRTLDGGISAPPRFVRPPKPR